MAAPTCTPPTRCLGNAAITSTGPYFIPNVKTDVYGVYTNNVPGAAFRGFGAPQALFMAEGQMNKLAEKLGMDPVEFRLKNALRDGLTLGVGTPAPGPVSVPQVIEAAADKFGWKQRPADASRNPGDTLGARPRLCRWLQERRISHSAIRRIPGPRSKSTGDGNIEHVVVHHAGAEVGQGTHTVMAQMAAEVVGVPSEQGAKVVPSEFGHPG